MASLPWNGSKAPNSKREVGDYLLEEEMRDTSQRLRARQAGLYSRCSRERTTHAIRASCHDVLLWIMLRYSPRRRPSPIGSRHSARNGRRSAASPVHSTSSTTPTRRGSLPRTTSPSSSPFVAQQPNRPMDWFVDFRATRGRWDHNIGEVHDGFYGALRKVWGVTLANGEVLPKRLVNRGNKTIWITGHSLGGALAELCAAQACSSVAFPCRASTRSGNRASAIRTSPPPSMKARVRYLPLRERSRHRPARAALHDGLLSLRGPAVLRSRRRVEHCRIRRGVGERSR